MLEFSDATHAIRRCLFDVQNEVGLGRREEAYHQACVHWFCEHEVSVVSKQPNRLLIDGEIAHSLFPDIVAFDSISIELKAEPRHLGRAEMVQLFDYLKCRQDRVGLLVNMGLDRVSIERVVYTPPECTLKENWDSWTSHIEGDDRRLGQQIRNALRNVYKYHQTGYGDEVVSKLVRFSLVQQGLRLTESPSAGATFKGISLGESSLDCIVIDERIVLTLSALFDSNNFNVNRCRSYLQALDLRWGIAADFGKTKAQFIGIRRGSS